MDDKIISINKGKAEDDTYLNPATAKVIQAFGDAINEYGCSEVCITFLDSDMEGYVLGTPEASLTMLGLMHHATTLYEQSYQEQEE